MKPQWTHIGDGVYAGLDGYGVMLHANSHDNPTDRIYLEPEVLKNLNILMTQQREREEDETSPY